MTKKNTRRGIFAWMLFDWANQPFHALVVTFVFAPYFASRVMDDPAEAQAIWGATTAAAGFLIAFLAPILGSVADAGGPRKPWLLAASVPLIVGSLGLWVAVPGLDPVFPVLIAFAVGYIGAEFTQIFSNAMLPDLAPRDEVGRISGSGWALGYLGGLVSLLLVLGLLAPVPGQTVTLLGIAPLFGLDPATGEPERAVGPFTVIWYVIFALPLLLYTPDEKPQRPLGRAVRAGVSNLVHTIRHVAQHRSLSIYLLASMIYRDGLAALFAFGGIYAAGVLGWGLFELGIFGIVAAGTGAVGAWLGGRVDDRLGPKPVIVAAIWLLIVVCTVLLLTTRQSVLLIPVSPESRAPDITFFIAGMLLGIGSGILGASSRTLLVHQAEDRIGGGQAFGLYALSGKATAFIGPALIAAITAATGSQQLGVSPVIGLLVVGAVLLHWVKTDEANIREQPA